MTILDLCRYGSAPCLLCAGGETVTYADLVAQGAEFAQRLGDGKKLLALEAAATPEAIAALYGAWTKGHAVALLPAGDTAAMDRFRRDFAPDAVFTQQGGRWRLLLDGRQPQTALHPDLSLVLMTSGSTGHGKAVRLSGAAVAANARAISEVLGIHAQDRGALVLPLHYAFGLSVLTSHLAAGASVWLAAGSILSGGFLDDMRALAVSNLQTVPIGYDLLEKAGFFATDLPDLRFLAVAGGALPPAVQRRFAAAMAERCGQFHAMYGQTEATARIACLPAALAETRAGCIGQAIPGGTLDLRDAQGALITQQDTEGELCYRGSNVMMGYASSRADLAKPADTTELATGDIARREADGLYRIVGRKRRMSKIAGVRIGHDSIEAALADHDIVAAVFGGDDELVVAYEGQRPAAEVAQITAEVATVMSRHVAALPVTPLPRLASGKVDYQALSAIARPARADGIEASFRACFHPVPVEDDDSFASLSGDSLQHVELALTLEHSLGHVPAGWEQMSLAALLRLEPGAQAGKQTIATEIAVRAGAIMAVVVTHQTLWPVYGGAAAMVVLIGLMLARFQLKAMAMGDARHVLSPLWRVLPPYYAILAGYALVWGQVPLGSALLISNFGIGDPVTHDRLPFLYWFVEAYAQMLVLLAGLVLLPAVRRAIARDPFRVGLWALAIAMGLRLFGADALGLGGRTLFTLPWVLYLAVFGWLIGTADTARRRWAVLALAAGVMPTVAYLGGNWYGSWLKYGCIFAVVALLLFVPRFACPGWLRRPVTALAASSYLVYLTHRFVPEVFLAGLEDILPGGAFSVLSVAGGIALGLVLTAAQRWLAAERTRTRARRLGAANRRLPLLRRYTTDKRLKQIP